MKKALIIATVGGFLSKFETNDAKLLQEMGYEVHYASDFQNRIYDFDEQELKEDGYVLHHINMRKNPFRIISLIKAIVNVKKVIQQENIELIHCHTPVGGVVGRVASRVCKKKLYVIYTAHGFHFYKGAPLLNWLLYYPVEYMLSKYTDCLITINQEDYKRSGRFLNKRNVWIPGVGIDVSRFRPGTEKNISPEQGFHLVSVGELNDNKNHKTVIKALEVLRDANIYYDIYGKGPGEAKLKKLIVEKGLEEQVRICGYHPRVEAILQQADCFVFPSLREGLGMAALEAMACGVPVIAADNRGTREYMEDGVNGIVCAPRKVLEFARAIQRIKEDENLRKELGSNAQTTVKKFTISENEKIMRRVYEKI